MNRGHHRDAKAGERRQRTLTGERQLDGLLGALYGAQRAEVGACDEALRFAGNEHDGPEALDSCQALEGPP